ncbi:MAG: hypothetical protein ACOY7J_21725 [Pseudomonadota bacterium]
MSSSIKKVFVLGACALAVSACVKLQWSAVFDREGSLGATPTLVQAGPGSSLLMAGQVSTGTDENATFPIGNAFVARYSAAGALEWSRELDNGTSLLGFTAMDSAADGSVYVADLRTDDGTTLLKLDASGNPVWQKNLSAELYNAAMRIVVVNSDLILVALMPSYDAGGPGSLLAFDSAGNALWQFSGVGVADGSPAPIDAEILSGNRVVSFASYFDPATGTDVSQLLVLNAAGGVDQRIEAQALGLDRIADTAVLNDQIVVAGSTGETTRLLRLDTQLDIVQQQDFAWKTPGIPPLVRLASRGATLCFAINSDSDRQDDYFTEGSTILGILDSQGKAWSGEQVGLNSLQASLSADTNRCAYTDRTQPLYETEWSASQTRLFSAKGIYETVQHPGSLLPAVLQATVLQGSYLVSALATSAADDPSRRQAKLSRHWTY